MSSNPLVQFRNPDSIIRKTGQTHATTRREDVSNDTEGLSSIYQGEFTYKPNPTLEIDLAFWEDNDHPKAISMYYQMIGSKGYQVAMFKDWSVAERLKPMWKKDAAGRLTLGGKAKNTMVLMWRTGQSYDIDQKKRLRWSDEISKSAEEKQAEMQDKLGSLGKVRVTIEDE